MPESVRGDSHRAAVPLCFSVTRENREPARVRPQLVVDLVSAQDCWDIVMRLGGRAKNVLG
ncbi:hypothetical protein D3C81_1321720 [compost metagenome]